jgi:hypothetical protein
MELELKGEHGTPSALSTNGAEKRKGLEGGRNVCTSKYTAEKNFVVHFNIAGRLSMGLVICLACVMVGVAKTVIVMKLDVVTEDGVFCGRTYAELSS